MGVTALSGVAMTIEVSRYHRPSLLLVKRSYCVYKHLPQIPHLHALQKIKLSKISHD